MKRFALLVLCTMISAKSFAGPIWGEWIAGGTSCNGSNVSVLESGKDLSILFDAFGVNMPLGDSGDGLSARKTCNFRISLTPPKGYYLANFRQVYNGGLIKSRGSSAQLNIQYNIGTVIQRPTPLIWRQGVQIRPEDSNSLFSRTFDNPLLVAACGGKTTYGINMSMSATRNDMFTEHLVGGLDSIEASFVQRLVLIPEWRLCP